MATKSNLLQRRDLQTPARFLKEKANKSLKQDQQMHPRWVQISIYAEKRVEKEGKILELPGVLGWKNQEKVVRGFKSEYRGLETEVGLNNLLEEKQGKEKGKSARR